MDTLTAQLMILGWGILGCITTAVICSKSRKSTPRKIVLFLETIPMGILAAPAMIPELVMDYFKQKRRLLEKEIERINNLFKEKE